MCRNATAIHTSKASAWARVKAAESADGGCPLVAPAATRTATADLSDACTLDAQQDASYCILLYTGKRVTMHYRQ